MNVQNLNMTATYKSGVVDESVEAASQVHRLVCQHVHTHHLCFTLSTWGVENEKPTQSADVVWRS